VAGRAIGGGEARRRWGEGGGAPQVEFFFVAKFFCKIFPLQNFFLLKVPCFLIFFKKFSALQFFFFDFPS